MITITSRSPVGMCVDAVVQGAPLRDRPDHERERIERDLRQIQAVFDTSAEDIATARQSRELTELGMRAALTKRLTTAANEMKRHVATAQRLQATAAATRASILKLPATERTAEVVLRERELRDRLSALEPHQVQIRYLRACETNDVELIRAVEHAPAAFPLVDDAMREKGQTIKLATAAPELKAQLEQQEDETQMYSYVVNTCVRQLNELAGQHGVRFSDL